MRHPSGPLVGALGAALALVLAGCGGTSAATTDSASTPVASSSSSSSTPSGSTSPSATPSSPTSPSSAGSVPTLGKASFGSSLAAAQKKAGSYHFTLDTAVLGRSIMGTGVATTGASPAVRVDLKDASGSSSVIVVHDIYYLKNAALHSAKPWLKVDPKAGGPLSQLLGSLSNADPSKSLQAFDEAAAVMPRSTRRIDGIQTRKYVVRLDSKVLASTLGYPARLAKLLPKTLTYDVWVDQQSLVRKLVTSIKVDGHTSTTTIGFSDYGSKVSVTAPPASRTTSRSPF